MGVIDHTQYKLICPQCGISEMSKVMEDGAPYDGSPWQAGTPLEHFETQWSDAGRDEPVLISAVCKTCNIAAIVEFGYSF